MSVLIVSVLDACLVGGDLSFDLLAFLVLVDSALFRCLNLGVLFHGLDLTVLERLDGGVVVVLVNFTVDNLLLSGLVLVVDVFMFHCRGNGLIDCGIFGTCSSSVNDWSYGFGLGVDLDLGGLDLLSRDLFGLDVLLGLSLLSLGGAEVLTCTGAGVILACVQLGQEIYLQELANCACG